MGVYVDNMRAGFGRMTMCHMIADSRAELDEMADKIGVQRKWIQHEGTHLEHYDVCLSKRNLAVQHGAVLLTMRELGLRIRAKRLSRSAQAVNAGATTLEQGATESAQESSSS
jgi:hypothetical protein